MVVSPFPQRSQTDNAMLEAPGTPQWFQDNLAKVQFNKIFVKWFGDIRDGVNSEDEAFLISPPEPGQDELAGSELLAGGARGIDPGMLLAAVELVSTRMTAARESMAELLAIAPRDMAASVLAEMVLLSPPTQRNWVDYLMNQAGGVIQLEGRTAAFPGLRRDETDTESVLADGSAITGHVASAIKLGGRTASSPSIVADGVDTRSELADGSAATGHTVLDDPYGPGWDGSNEVPTKNAIFDEIDGKIPSAIPVPIAEGGTGATNAPDALTNLGAAPGFTGLTGTIVLATTTSIDTINGIIVSTA